MSFINNNGKLPKETKEDFLNAIISIHENKNNKFGFDFDTQIGGLKQINKKVIIGSNFIEIIDWDIFLNLLVNPTNGFEN